VEVLPLSDRPPAWALPVVAAFAAARPEIDSRLNVGVTSDAAVAARRPELIGQGFEIEKGNGRQALSERRADGVTENPGHLVVELTAEELTLLREALDLHV
jgi:hypothetical protein